MKENVSRNIDNIFTTNLGVKKTEKVIVFTDTYSDEIRRIAMLVTEAGRKFTDTIRHIEFTPTGCHGVEPPEEIWYEAYGAAACDELRQNKLFTPIITKKLPEEQVSAVEKIIKKYKDNAVNVIIALSNFSTTHTRFRDMLNRICGSRYASMPLFDEQMLMGPMSVNWRSMQERTETIASTINKHENIKIKTPNGTSITFSKKGRDAMLDTGIITGPGQFSNLPAGEVYLAPLEGTANGRLVLEWGPTRKLKSPVILHIKKGVVAETEGEEEYVNFLNKKLSERTENRNIAELGIGTNNMASRPDNILESEKISGTIHIALGDNSSFGGKVRTSFHQDFVFFHPTVVLTSREGNKKILLKNGEIFNNGILEKNIRS